MVLLNFKNNKLFVSTKDVSIFNFDDKLKQKIVVPPIELADNKKLKNAEKVISLEWSLDSSLIVLAMDNKQVIVLDDGYNVLKTFTTERCPSKAIFTKSNDVVVADKTGDVYLFEGDSPPKLLLGHLSIILDMILSDCNKFIITCDRDEKIRVSSFPNAYNIVSYCLGHTEFVTSLKIVGNCLVSSSGDGTVRFWNFQEGCQVALLDTNTYIEDKEELKKFVQEMDNEKVHISALPIEDMNIYKNVMAVSIYKYGIQLYTVDFEKYVNTLLKKIELNCLGFCLTSDKLFVINMDSLKIFDCSNNFILKENSKLDEFFEDTVKTELCLSNITFALYKRRFDNVQEYFERKKQRLSNK